MNGGEQRSFSDKEYYAMWGVNTEEDMHFLKNYYSTTPVAISSPM